MTMAAKENEKVDANKLIVDVGLDSFLQDRDDPIDPDRKPILMAFRKVILEILEDDPAMTEDSARDIWYGFLDGWSMGQEQLRGK